MSAQTLKRPVSSDKGRTLTKFDATSAQRALSQRLQTLEELVVSERRYVEDLRILYEEFEAVIEAKKLLPEKVRLAVFGNCGQLRQVHGTLLKELEKAEKPLVRAIKSRTQVGQAALKAEAEMARAFTAMAPFLKASSSYCAGYRQAIQTLKDHPIKLKVKGLDVHSYLVKPMQRICKYPLFFRDLASRAEPGARGPVAAALDTVQQVAESVNAAVDGARLVEIYTDFFGAADSIGTLVTPSRKFVLEGRLGLKIRDKTVGGAKTRPTTQAVQYHYFLFSDLLLVASDLPASQTKGELRYRFDLVDLEIRDAVDPAHPAVVFARYAPSPDGGSFSHKALPDLAATTSKLDLAFIAHSDADAEKLRSELTKHVRDTKTNRAALDKRRSASLQ